ncbi:hypothetical protein FSP39_001674 [Pinctada imbricata]|uniref:Uncharacterized protein n=1 Tax=Pinctada imbricata TaxID=66713 RepID=A0AA88XPC5_PINIB|nr:hypothetical protein FSP39_001674 [Pinctada imbricata]
MSRAAVSKSRADKGAKPPQSHTPVVAHEIVPGKFNDQDWSFMLDKDSSEDVVDKIMEDLVDTTMDNIYKLYTERQLLPFTVSQAKDAILSIVEWQFLSRDEGEVEIDNDQSWMEDEEPEPAFTDCWAQGSVPKQLIPPRPISPVAEIFLEHPDDKDEDIVPGPEREETKEEEAEKEDEVTEEVPVIKEESDVKVEEKKKEEKKRKFKFKPYRGRVKSGGLNKLMSESLEQTEMKMWAAEIEASYEQAMERNSGLLNMPASCHSILKVQSGRPPGNKDVLYDDMGNVMAVVKLNPDKLPSHRVKVNYQIVDPSVEAAQARLDAMRHGKFTRLYLKKKKPAIEEFDEATDLQEMKTTESKTDLPPPLIEAMELAPGVTVKESGRVRRGPARYIRKSDILSTSIKGLHPVNTHSTRPPLEVTDLLDRHTPILRPIRDSPPLPPIIPSPPNYKRQVST